MVFFIVIPFSIENSVANSGDPDHMPHSAVSHVGQYCLSMSHKKDARLIWVNNLEPVF